MSKSKKVLLKEWGKLGGKKFKIGQAPSVKDLEKLLKDLKDKIEAGASSGPQGVAGGSSIAPGDQEESEEGSIIDNEITASGRSEAEKASAAILKTKEPNFTDFPSLQKEFKAGKMPEKKRIALKLRLIKLFKSEKIFENERDFMLLMFRRDRKKGELSSVDSYLLHSIESGMCSETCFVSTDDAPVVHHLRKGLECRFSKDPETDWYSVYVPRTLPAEFQMDRKTVIKQLNGHPISEDEIPEPRVLIKRLYLSPKEFGAWFEISEDDILEGGYSKNEMESYTF